MLVLPPGISISQFLQSELRNSPPPNDTLKKWIHRRETAMIKPSQGGGREGEGSVFEIMETP